VSRSTESVHTVLAVFTVEPVHQHRLVDVLAEATDQVMTTMVGFLGSAVYASQDGRQVVNVGHWRSAEDFRRMLADPRARAHFGICRELSSHHAYVDRLVYSRIAPIEEASMQ
jgi:heme-degrading monooxygenase HmoA